jgi:hypothetical protein
LLGKQVFVFLIEKHFRFFWKIFSFEIPGA